MSTPINEETLELFERLVGFDEKGDIHWYAQLCEGKVDGVTITIGGQTSAHSHITVKVKGNGHEAFWSIQRPVWPFIWFSSQLSLEDKAFKLARNLARSYHRALKDYNKEQQMKAANQQHALLIKVSSIT